MSDPHARSFDPTHLTASTAGDRPARLTIADPDRARSCQVPVATLLPADSPRINGVDPDHVARLAATDQALPSILVDRRTMRVIDGTHRLLAAAAAGRTMIDVEFFDGNAADAFLRAVEANVTHGLPLSREDRQAAARRIVHTHPHMSDRGIADIAGLSAKTVAVVRRCLDDPKLQPANRLGRDGKRHPVDKNAGRFRAAALIAADPDASLRVIARRAGVSPATVSDVRKRLASGQPPANPEPEARADAADRPSAPTVPTPAPPAPVAPRRPDPAPVLAVLVRDPSLRTKEDGRQLLRLLHRTAADKRELPALASMVPAHCVDAVHGLARNYAQMWMEFAEQLG